MNGESQLNNSHLENGTTDQPAKLWEHGDPRSTQMWEFLLLVNKKYGLALKAYDDLHQWSVDNVAKFWEEVWDFTGIVSDKRFSKVPRYVH
jgi:acetoacetyl-CoA synthetase